MAVLWYDVYMKNLKDEKVNVQKLIEFGFVKEGNGLLYSTPIVDGQFALTVRLQEGRLTTKIVEVSTQEEYILHLTDATGEFVGRIRADYKKVLEEIENKCFDSQVFKSPQAKAVIEYIRKTYGDELEFLWEKFPKNAIWRRKDNKKWYAALLVISKRKLNLDEDGEVEIVDLRADAKLIEGLVDNRTIYEGYHMNKKHWITICLDHTLPSEKIFEFVDESYALAKKK